MATLCSTSYLNLVERMPRLKREWTPQSTRPRGKVQRCSGTEGGNEHFISSVLPSHVWCWLARHGDIGEFSALRRASKSLFTDSEADALWHYHAYKRCLVHPINHAQSEWVYPFAPEVTVDACIDWHRFLRMNVELGRNSSAIWIRLRDRDLRLPVQPGTTMEKLVFMLTSVLVCRGRSFCKMQQASSNPQEEGCPQLRLRHLQWAGRPGPVVTAPVMGGEHLLLEWISVETWQWPLPPHSPQSPQDQLPVALKNRPASLLGAALLPWRRPESPTGRGSQGISPDNLGGSLALVRVMSAVDKGTGWKRPGMALIHDEIWVVVELLSCTLNGLFHKIREALCQPNQTKAACELLQEQHSFRLADDKHPQGRLDVGNAVLRDLCWAQCETVTIERRAQLDEQFGAIVLVRREVEFKRVQRSGPEKVDPELGELAVGADTSEAEIVSPQRENTRQRMWWCCEPEERDLRPSYTGMLRQSSAASSYQGCTANGAASRAASPTRTLPGMPVAETCETVTVAPELCGPLAAHPGDTAVEDESLLDSESPIGSFERVVPHYPPKLLLSSHQTRQFEFHPTLPDAILTGDKKGGVNVIKTDEEGVRPPLVIDSCPVLGLSWMHHHPQRAVCGGAQSGQIRFLRYNPEVSQSMPCLQHVSAVDDFPKLSSLSMNCTDDFLLASGFTHDLVIYDTTSGKVVHKGVGVHNHYINISRFANKSPHIFATASFDHTCKIWDLRQPLVQDRPVKVLHTGGLNVMCTFSADDSYLLCSGIDTRVTQFEVPSLRRTPDKFQLRPAKHPARYRRSMYFATGRHFVTAATDESYIRVMSSSGKSLGVVDFRGLLGTRLPQLARSGSSYGPQPRPTWEPMGPIVRGEVQLNDEGTSGPETTINKEYVQSVRTHPLVENRVGVLLSSYHPDPQSYIAFVHLDPRFARD